MKLVREEKRDEIFSISDYIYSGMCSSRVIGPQTLSSRIFYFYISTDLPLSDCTMLKLASEKLPLFSGLTFWLILILFYAAALKFGVLSLSAFSLMIKALLVLLGKLEK